MCPQHFSTQQQLLQQQQLPVGQYCYAAAKELENEGLTKITCPTIKFSGSIIEEEGEKKDTGDWVEVKSAI